MIQIPDSLRTVFSTELRTEDDRYVIEVPKAEVAHDAVSVGDVYQVAVLSRQTIRCDSEEESGAEAAPESSQDDGELPVEAGDRRVVTIEHTGSQGDGIAKIDGGFVVVVPNTEPGDQPLIEITRVKETVAFGTALDRH